jgi:hypothetical protein
MTSDAFSNARDGAYWLAVILKRIEEAAITRDIGRFRRELLKLLENFPEYARAVSPVLPLIPRIANPVVIGNPAALKTMHAEILATGESLVDRIKESTSESFQSSCVVVGNGLAAPRQDISGPSDLDDGKVRELARNHRDFSVPHFIAIDRQLARESNAARAMAPQLVHDFSPSLEGFQPRPSAGEEGNWERVRASDAMLLLNIKSSTLSRWTREHPDRVRRVEQGWYLVSRSWLEIGV